MLCEHPTWAGYGWEFKGLGFTASQSRPQSGGGAGAYETQIHLGRGRKKIIRPLIGWFSLLFATLLRGTVSSRTFLIAETVQRCVAAPGATASDALLSAGGTLEGHSFFSSASPGGVAVG